MIKCASTTSPEYTVLIFYDRVSCKYIAVSEDIPELAIRSASKDDLLERIRAGVDRHTGGKHRAIRYLYKERR